MDEAWIRHYTRVDKRHIAEFVGLGEKPPMRIEEDRLLRCV